MRRKKMVATKDLNVEDCIMVEAYVVSKRPSSVANKYELVIDIDGQEVMIFPRDDHKHHVRTDLT